MSKAELPAELPKLQVEDRREIFDRICEMEESDLLRGGAPTTEEKALLDRELEEYRQNPDARSTWKEVQARLDKTSPLRGGSSSILLPRLSPGDHAAIPLEAVLWRG